MSLARIPFFHPARQFFKSRPLVIDSNPSEQFLTFRFIVQLPAGIDRLSLIAGVEAEFSANLLDFQVTLMNIQHLFNFHPIRKFYN